MEGLPAAAAVALGAALLAGLLGALTRTGVVAAAAVGTAILSGLGLPGAVALLAFFLPATLVSHWLERVPDDASAQRGRGARQVLANGGPAAVAALLAPVDTGLALWAATGSLAAAAADTLATAVGTTRGPAPRHILTREPVTPGTSGGITLRGTLGGLVGAGIVAGAGAVMGGGPWLLACALLLGTAWMLGDSLLGGALQGRYHCPACDAVTEHRVHRCGHPTTHTGGQPWLTNDGVNLLATLGAALDSALCWWLFS